MTPPQENCTHPRENEKGVRFFFLHECFGAIIPFEKPKIESPSHLNWINLQRDEHGNGLRKVHNNATLSFYKNLIKRLKVRIYLKIELKSNK